MTREITPPNRPGIRITGARKFFHRTDGTAVPAIDGIDLVVEPGSFVVLLGPSGCGKTTLLRGIAGLEQLDEGKVERDGTVLFDSAARVDLAPERRPVSMMFQSYALWPHLSVAQNVGYPLRARKVGRPETRRRVAEILRTVGIPELAEQYPSQISGGQQQRVALARALVSGDGVVLFDEPLSNVDARVREHLRGELRRLHAELGFTAVYVTHDQDEALALATTVTVLEKGRVAQSAPPREVYRHPRSPYVARFLGTINELSGTIVRVGPSGTVARTEIGEITGSGPDGAVEGTPVTVFSRPEAWRSLPGTANGVNTWSAEWVADTFHGFYADHEYRIGETTVKVRTVGDAPTGGALTVDPADVHLLQAARETAAAPGTASDTAPNTGPTAAAQTARSSGTPEKASSDDTTRTGTRA